MTPSDLPDLSHEEILRYSRHLVLPEIGMTGQKRLKAARVLIVGAGGLGSPAALYLAGAGVGHIGIVDADTVSLSNLQRQVLHATSTLDRPKVESARDRMIDLNPDIAVVPYNEAFTAESAERIALGYDLIVDGTDNFPTRYLINDVCLRLGIPFAYGAIFRMDGQASLFCTDAGPCYRCVFPQPPQPETVMTCTEAGVLGVVPGLIGLLQATEVVKWFAELGTSLAGRLLIYDAANMQFEAISLSKNPECPVCSLDPSDVTLIDYGGFCGMPGGEAPVPVLPEDATISPKELKAKLDDGEAVIIVDVRRPAEREIAHIKGSLSIPRDELERRIGELDRESEIVVVCRIGERSARAVGLLRKAGFIKARNLVGGLMSWIDEADPALPKY